MLRRVRTVKTRAVALTDADPKRVSLCTAGANQSPLSTLKSDGIVLVEKKELQPMLTRMKQDGFEVISFSFKGESWTTEAVSAWLAEGGYDKFTVEGEAGALSVKSEDAQELGDDAETREITTEDGITVVVAKAKEAPAEETAEAEVIEGEATEVAKTGDEAVQPVATADDVSAVVTTLKAAEALPALSQKGFCEINELVYLVRGLKWMVEDQGYSLVATQFYNGDEAKIAQTKETLVALKNAGGWMLIALQAMLGAEMDELWASFSTETAKEAEAEPVIEGEATVVEKTTDEPAAEPAVEAEPVVEAPAVETQKTGDEPPAWAAGLIASVQSITQSVETLTGQVTEVATKQADLEGRMTPPAKADPVPARKSVAPDGQPDGSPEVVVKTKDGRSMADLRTKAALGI